MPDGSPTPPSHLDPQLRRRLAEIEPDAQPAPGVSDAFWIGVTARLIAQAAEWLADEGIGSVVVGPDAPWWAGAVTALALEPTDPALLHHADLGFYCGRSQRAGLDEPLGDLIRSMVGAVAEPMSGGRWASFGHPDLSILPTTGQPAGHAPRALGLAWSMHRAQRLGAELPWPDDAVVACTLDAGSAAHADAYATVRGAERAAEANLPMPLVLVVDGPAPVTTLPVVSLTGDFGNDLPLVQENFDRVRRRRRPVIVAAPQRRSRLADLAPAAGPGVLAEYDALQDQVLGWLARAAREPTLASADEIVAPLAPRQPAIVAQTVSSRLPTPAAAPDEAPRTVAEALTGAFTDALAAYPHAIMCGPQVSSSPIAEGLRGRFGAARVFDTVPDETVTLGLAQGAGALGLLPIVEFPHVADAYRAADQLATESASTQFISRGRWRTPLVLRAGYGASWAGAPGQVLADNSISLLRDIPGLVIAAPARADDVAAMVRTVVAAAEVDGTNSVILEPTSLFYIRDLHADSDGQWLGHDAAPELWSEAHIPIGRAKVYGGGRDLTIISFGHGLWASLRAASRLSAERIKSRVVDLRWLNPLPITELVRASNATGKVIVVDETRRTGGIGEAVLAALMEAGYTGRARRVASEDSFVPIGPAAERVLVTESAIERVAHALLRR